MIAGVGHVGSAARGLRGTASTTRSASASRPAARSLGICVGMQLLFGESDEGGRGLGLLDGPVRAPAGTAVPHMGWNTLAATRPSAILDGLDGADVYFAHSYAAEPADEDVTAATSTMTARSSPPSSTGRSPESSSTPSAVALQGPRARERRCDGQEARDPLPRRRRRPRRQGRQLPRPARRSATRSSSRRGTRSSAPTSSSSSTSRRPSRGAGPIARPDRARRRRS